MSSDSSSRHLDGTVTSNNPYSRLMALKRMGVVEEYEAIVNKTVLIVGIGGVGSVSAEMLTRCGVGKLILIDFDRVELANMNRLFFKPSQAGMDKVDAAKQTLAEINPDVNIEAHSMNISSVDHYGSFVSLLTCGSLIGGPIDLLLSCVDNYEARMTINKACNQHGQVWMESGVSEDAVNGHIQTIKPGRTACFACTKPLIVDGGIPESTLKREGVCAASLPTTMGLIAALLVQNSLKYMLNFGRVSYYLGYASLQDNFPTWPMKANPQCSDQQCLLRQKEMNALNLPSCEEEEDLKETARRLRYERSIAAQQLDNEWNIEIVGREQEQQSTEVDDKLKSLGLSRDSDEPVSSSSTAPVVDVGGRSLADLMAGLRDAQK